MPRRSGGLAEQQEWFKSCVCRIENQADDALGTGILIHPNYVLTAYHVIEDLVVSNNDDLVWRGAGPLVVFSGRVIFHAKPTNVSRFSKEDDYVIFPIQSKPRQDFLDLFEELALPGVERAEKLRLFHFADKYKPEVSSAREIMGGQLEGDLYLHDAWTEKGHSGALVALERNGVVSPIAMHQGRLEEGRKVTRAPGACGVALRLSTVRKALEVRPLPSPPERVSLFAFAGRPDADESHAAALRRLLDGALADVVPTVNGKDLADLDKLPTWNEDQLAKATEADAALVIISAQDTHEERHKLFAVYGYLCARLGRPRVYLVHHQSVNVDWLVPSETAISYTGAVLNMNGAAILEAARSPSGEDDHGLFEVRRIALSTHLGDAHQTPYLDAAQDLVIIGLRFRRLENQLTQIVRALEDKRFTLTIAFPSIELVEKHPYLLDRDGEKSGTAAEILKLLVTLRGRIDPKLVTFIPLDEIPVVVATVADMDSHSGRMVATPVVKTEVQAPVPRVVLRDKHSIDGLFDAYRDVIKQQLERVPKEKRWTLADADRTTQYAVALWALRRPGWTP